MTLSELSIKRPVLAIVSSLLIVTLGVWSMFSIPVRELPDVDRAVVTVSTTYTGAAPQVVDTDITTIIESAISSVSGIESITSQSRRGSSRTVIEFDTGIDLDAAAIDVRDAVGRVTSSLPEDADEPRVIKSDSDSDPVMRLAVASDRHAPEEITDYLERFVVDRLSTLDGVASVDLRGERRFALRIWVDRRALAARQLTLNDVQDAIQRTSVERPAGDLESVNRQMEIRLDGRLSSAEEFRNIVITIQDGYPVRLGDVARVDMGVEAETTIVRANGQPAVGMQVLRQSQSNTMAISESVRAEVADIQRSMPEGMTFIVGSDDALFISASLREVGIALALSLGLVVLVILVFLRSARATLVPLVTIPVALIGCLAMIAGLGFSINVLTLLALLLAIGLVVDDAIVVLENIKRRIDMGETPLVAAVRGTREVTFAVLATSVTLVAVFIPISFLGGQVGRLFSEFGLVLAAAVVISTYVALSLCPMLASRILGARRASPKTGQGDSDDTRMAQSVLGRLYGVLLSGALKNPLVVLGVSAAFVAGAVALYPLIPNELAPREDRGVAFIPLTAPQGATRSYTNEQAKLIEAGLQLHVDSGLIETVYAIVGWRNNPYRGFVVMRLPHWDDRTESQAQIVRKLQPAAMRLIGARSVVISPAGLGLRGSRTPLQLVVSGANFEDVKEWAARLQAYAQDNPGILNPELDYEENQPQLSLSLDRLRMDDLGLDMDTIANTIQVLFTGDEVTTYIDRGREYPVIIQAESTDRRAPSDISNIFMRLPGAEGSRSLVPLEAVLTSEETAAAATLRRFDRLPAITLQAGLTDGYALGDAIAYMEQGAAEIISEGAQIGYSGQTAVFRETSGQVVFTLAVALLIVFLVLAAQFESFVHPFVIMLAVPTAVAGAVYALFAFGLTLNIYSQIGIILLIGLMAKNGILIVEFANQLRDQGKSVHAAVFEAAILRFRPILMTVISTVLGAVPLVLATGAGAESRIAIGSVIVGGLMISLFLTLFLTPVLYNALAGFSQPRSATEQRLAAELDAPRVIKS